MKHLVVVGVDRAPTKESALRVAEKDQRAWWRRLHRRGPKITAVDAVRKTYKDGLDIWSVEIAEEPR